MKCPRVFEPHSNTDLDLESLAKRHSVPPRTFCHVPLVNVPSLLPRMNTGVPLPFWNLASYAS